ncbi:hypothetical protein BS47DRAFT_798061 [Hydnum rufescens UP504]|uniref:Uncharacterized protein n=1 Tax=Hydnum rufescens UP504 TaxID=1448309 RepID=A0A9P6B0D3_9AGAM|nr:hypothetical protein BS47DRAFT_798061 [Hydnum rufescens UP504]
MAASAVIFGSEDRLMALADPATISITLIGSIFPAVLLLTAHSRGAPMSSVPK